MGKTIVEINSSTVGSTGRIMFMIAETARKSGFQVFTSSAVHGNEKKIEDATHIYIGNKYDKKLHLMLARYTGYNGCYSHITTKHFLKKLDTVKPDLLHFHNLHNCYINLPMLFSYVKKNNIPVVWTLHDCWSYTGHCPYYDYSGCRKWETGCHDCPLYKEYPYSNVDRSEKIYKLKREWFTGANITIVTPSQWLAGEVSCSFLREYPVKVINNGIDLGIFRPRNSDVKTRYSIDKDKKVILGVASSWANRKGLDIFQKLAVDLPDTYQVVVVGISKEQAKMMPDNVVSINRTNNQIEMAEIYSAADLFVNPTREENFPTTNIEALACGTPVVTFMTGGSPEILDKNCGITIEKDNYNGLIKAIDDCIKQPFEQDACLRRAKLFSREQKYSEYVDLFFEILREK